MSEIESLIKRLTDDDNGVSMSDCTRAAELLRELDALRKQEPLAWRNPHNGAVIDAGRKNQEGVGGGYPNFNQPLYAAPIPPAAVAAVPDSLMMDIIALCDSVNGDAYMGKDWEETQVARVRKALAATPAPVAQKVPEGFVLVPKEPTKAMLDSGDVALLGPREDRALNVYEAMLAAAQAQEGGK